MVWFQCEDCGDNLKKPKLANHFRTCSASKLSCIDCGQTFGQQSVQGHAQCITEAEKYGPKGQEKAQTVPNGKPNNQTKAKPDVDINVGLSQRPPWFCSLCNTKATSQQTLLLHAEGKKHRAKARAFHAKQQPKQGEESAPTEITVNGESQDDKSVAEAKAEGLPKDGHVKTNSEEANGDLSSNKKRKLDVSERDGTDKNSEENSSGEAGNGEVIHVEEGKTEDTKRKSKKTKHDVSKEDKAEPAATKEVSKGKINWKKLIKSALKSSPDGVLKMRKLQKLVLKALQESGVDEDKSHLSEMLEHKITSSSRFTVDGKYVRLAAKE